MNILDNADCEDAYSVAEGTLTSTPARKLISLTAVDPSKLVQFGAQELSFQENSNFSSTQLPITPINKVVKLSSANHYSPRMDGRGDSSFGSLVKLDRTNVRETHTDKEYD